MSKRMFIPDGTLVLVTEHYILARRKCKTLNIVVCSATSVESYLCRSLPKASQRVRVYFNILLEREKERQSLPLKVEEQLALMEKVAGTMASFKQSTCTNTEMKDIIQMSLEDELSNYLNRYSMFPENDVPTEGEFLQKLAHAFYY